jgi:2-hydroxychromene-2-carboxylate isomerase
VSGTNKQEIDFYFDYISHNAYLAWHVLPALAQEYGYSVRPVPVLFAGFLKAFGQLGPAEIAPKLDWMNRNNLRKAKLAGIPFNPPKMHPFNPLFLLRLTAQNMPETDRCRITECVLRAVWVDGIDPNDRDAIGICLGEIDVNATELIANATGDSAKALVRSNTEEAIARGAFGVPTMIVGDEVLWGYDDLPFLEGILAGRDPLSEPDLSQYLAGWEDARVAGQHRR